MEWWQALFPAWRVAWEPTMLIKPVRLDINHNGTAEQNLEMEAE